VMAAIVGGAMVYAWSRPNPVVDAHGSPAEVDESSPTGTA
jgi:hypothetical protein